MTVSIRNLDMSDRTVLIRVPIGAAYALAGKPFDMEEALASAIANGLAEKKNMPQYQFRYTPVMAKLSGKTYDSLRRPLHPEGSTDIIGRFAGAILSLAMNIPIVPLSGWLPTAAQSDTAKVKRA